MNLLLLPGLLCDRAVWAPVLPALETMARCHVPDYADERSLGAMAERVLRDAPATFSVAGHSMGGRVALEIVRRVPERVERLGLLDTGFLPRPQGRAGDDERSRRLALLALAEKNGMRAMAREWVQPMVHPARLADEAFMDTILDMFERRTPAQFAAQIDALLARPDASPLLPALRCPTLVLCGRADGWSTPAQHAEMAAMIAGSRLVFVEGGGHMAPMECPDATAAAMLEWLRTPAAVEVVRTTANPPSRCLA
jgi:pimeloyl-ACP methyl ester carboxylesterase